MKSRLFSSNHRLFTRIRPFVVLTFLSILALIIIGSARGFQRAEDLRPQSEGSLILTTPVVSQLVQPGPWLSYVSEPGGYAIDYPPNWSPSTDYSENGGVIFKLRDPQDTQTVLMIGVTVVTANAAPSLEDVVEAKSAMIAASEENGNSLAVSSDSIRVDGLEARQIVGREEQFPLKEVVVVKGNRVYTIWASPYESDHPLFGKWVTDLDLVFHRMVNSVRFED